MTTIDAILTVAHAGNQDATGGLLHLASQVLPNASRYVLTAGPVAVGQLDSTPLPTSDWVARVGIAIEDVFAPPERLDFCRPFAAADLLERHKTVLFLDSGLLLASMPEEIESLLETHILVLASPHLVTDTQSPTALLRALADSQALTTRIAAFSQASRGLLDEWRAAMLELPLDVAQRSPSDVTAPLLSSFLGRRGVAVAGSETVLGFREYSAIEAGGVHGAQAAIVEADELWSIARARREASDRPEGHLLSKQERDEDARTLQKWLHLLRGTHQSGSAGALIRTVETAVEQIPSRQVPDFEMLAADIRRAVDPFGSRFPAGEGDAFLDWLYVANSKGLTRIAHLVWMRDGSLQAEFPGVRRDPKRFIRWCQRYSFGRFGFHLLDPSISPIPSVDAVAPPRPLPERLSSAVRWRINSAKLLLPGYGTFQRRKYETEETIPRRPREPSRRKVRSEPIVWGPAPRDISVLGLFRSESGLGQAARATVSALTLLDRPFSFVDTSDEYLSRNAADPGLSEHPLGATGSVNIVHSNADEMVTLGDRVFRHRLAGRFNAAMWFWETAKLPLRARSAFEHVDELWLASQYLADVFGQYGEVPVRVIGLAADLPRTRDVERSQFGLRDDELVFLFVYDALSGHGRKNPEKAVDAFIKAFGPDYDGVRFVLKVSNLHLFVEDRRRLMAYAEACPALVVLDGYYPRERVMDLMSVADVYVSLHAAEGYGLTLLESMALGTPVICTGYSGNMDFTTAENSWLVDYDIRAIEEPTGPYRIGSVWASPRVDSVVDLMRSVADSPGLIAEKARVASQDARSAASIHRYADRLNEELSRVL